jgi:alkylated DNA repair protein alkB homolog 6
MAMADQNPSQNLTAQTIPNLPSIFYYIPNFLSSAECDSVLEKVTCYCPTQVLACSHLQIPVRRWTAVSGRRVQAHPSTLAKGEVLLAAPLPDWLTSNPPILDRFKSFGIFNHTKHGHPNHVLVNEYKPGEGIMFHEDGPAYDRVTATVSLGGTLVLDIKEKSLNDEILDDQPGDHQPSPKSWRILQEPGSLLVTVDDAYSTLLHGISYIEQDSDLRAETVANWALLGNAEAFSSGTNHRTLRTSLTYRDVLKVAKLGGVLGGRK